MTARRPYFLPACKVSLALGLLLSPMAFAAVTDISPVPLWSSRTSVVKPNVLFTLDDSGSMAWDFLPDNANFTGASDRAFNRWGQSWPDWALVGRYSSQCNGVAYDTTVDAGGNYLVKYDRPVDYKGVDVDAGKPSSSDIVAMLETDDASNETRWPIRLSAIPFSSLTAKGTLTVTWASGGMVDGDYFVGQPVTVYDSSNVGRYMVGLVSAVNVSKLSVTIDVKYGRDLGNSFVKPVLAYNTPVAGQVYYTYSGTQRKLGYTYSGNSLVADAFYNECSTDIATAATAGVFKPVIMTPNSPDVGRFWAWKNYYSTRMAMMKTSMSRAFKNIDSEFRVGFTTILKKDAIPGDEMLDVKDFDDSQKQAFYSSLTKASPGGSTPLRGALSKAGQYYAKKASGQTYDPVQYSCQKNFLILSTDGYWNTGAEVAGSYGPYGLDGKTSVGNQDGIGTPTPLFEGGYQKDTVVYRWPVDNTWTKVVKSTTSQVETLRKTYTQNRTVYSTAQDAASCPLPPYTAVKAQLQERNAYYNQAVKTSRIDYTSMSRKDYWERTDVITSIGASTSVETTKAAALVTTGTDQTVGVAKPTEYVYTPDPEVLLSSPAPTAWTAKGGLQLVSCSTTLPSPSTTAAVNVGEPVVTSLGKTGTLDVVTSSRPTTESAVAKAGAEVEKTHTTEVSGATSNTLADVAAYYYNTDLRDTTLSNCTGSLGKDVCTNNVAPVGRDSAKHQHLTTFGISLGNNGTIRYNPEYPSTVPNEAAGIINDFYYLGNQAGSEAEYGIARGATKVWPTPLSAEGPTRIDDLFHAAVNGHGRYFSASDPNSLSFSLAKAIQEIKKVKGTSAAAATSTLQPVKGDNGLYISQFTSPAWTGDLKKYVFNKDGSVSTSVIVNGDSVDTSVWSASAKLTPTTTRKIYYFRPGSGSTGSLVEFDAANMSASEKLLFQDACNKAVATDNLSQCSTVDATTKSSLNSPTDMVSYLRGQAKAGYRAREAVLGDLVNSAPVFIGAPGFSYTENDYDTTFAVQKAGRQRALLVGGNDGMLHAFKEDPKDATTVTGGTELWAYVPRLVMNKMYKLADTNYATKHQYMVDGTPVLSDIVGPDGKWRSIVVGGLNSGGRGYYALDVTDPANPVAMWEFGPDQLGANAGRLGFSYGNPIVTKAADGTWIVAFTSGLNNPDGGGYLFIVNANTGALIKTLSTGVGTADSPSGLTKINAWIDSLGENKALRIYGGDMTGRLYRFDFNGSLGHPTDVVQLAQFNYSDATTPSTPQPITTMPMLAQFNANGAVRRVVYVGTGRYLGASDIPASTTDGAQQSVYAIVDTLGPTGFGDIRAGTDLVKQPVDTTVTPRTVGNKNTLVDWSQKKGWFADLAAKAERVNVDMALVANTLLAVGNVPGSSASDCEDPAANSSWLYSFNIITGNGNVVGLGSLVAGLGAIQTELNEDGTGGDIVGVVTSTKGEIVSPKINPLTASGAPARRTTWRELR